MPMEKFCLTVSLLFALLMAGCASTGIHSSKQSLWVASDEAAAIHTDHGRGTQSVKNEPFFPNTDVPTALESTATQAVNYTDIYLADTSFSAENYGPGFMKTDISFSPLEAYQECCRGDNEPDGRLNLISDGFTLAQEKTGDSDFNEFEKEFGDVAVDTREQETSDPLIGYNRVMFNVNDKLYFWLLKPVARGYGAVIPEGGRVGISRFFKNLSFPVRFVNNALQGKFKRAGIETARFAINTTVGILGFFDPADKWWELEPYEEDFGQTLGHYGGEDGFPLTLPLLGPSNFRDTLGIVPDIFFYPIDLLYQGSQLINPIFLGAFILETVNKTSLRIGVYENFKKEALDPYTLMRDAYKQNRDARIKE